MWLFPFLLDDPPAGDKGQGGSPPAGSDDGAKGKGDKPPADAQGQGEIEKKAKSYDELFPKFTNLSKERGRLAEKAKEFGFEEDEVESFVDEAITEIRRMDTELKTLKGEKPPGSDDKDKDKDKDKGTPSGLSEKIMGHISTAARFSLDAKKDSQYNTFLRKHPDFDESLKEGLDKEIDNLMENPSTSKALKKGNWYETALRSQMLDGDDFLGKVEKAAVEKENKRLQTLKDQELITGGAAVGGKGTTLEGELKKRFGGSSPPAS